MPNAQIAREMGMLLVECPTGWDDVDGFHQDSGNAHADLSPGSNARGFEL
jgi:hypothetical protein